MNARGWKTSEPGGESLQPEKPELVTVIGDSLRAKGLSDPEIAALAGFTEDSTDNPFAQPGRHLRVM